MSGEWELVARLDGGAAALFQSRRVLGNRQLAAATDQVAGSTEDADPNDSNAVGPSPVLDFPQLARRLPPGRQALHQTGSRVLPIGRCRVARVGAAR
jgi:hypothetical protein